MPLPLSRACLIKKSQEGVIFVWITTELFLSKYIQWKHLNPEYMTMFSPTCTQLSKTTFMLLLWLEKVTRKYSRWNQFISFYKLSSQKCEYHLFLNVNAFSLPISPFVKFIWRRVIRLYSQSTRTRVTLTLIAKCLSVELSFNSRFNDLDLSRPGFQLPIFRMWGECYHRLRDLRG